MTTTTNLPTDLTTHTTRLLVGTDLDPHDALALAEGTATATATDAVAAALRDGWAAAAAGGGRA